MLYRDVSTAITGLLMGYALGNLLMIAWFYFHP